MIESGLSVPSITDMHPPLGKIPEPGASYAISTGLISSSPHVPPAQRTRYGDLDSNVAQDREEEERQLAASPKLAGRSRNGRATDNLGAVLEGQSD